MHVIEQILFHFEGIFHTFPNIRDTKGRVHILEITLDKTYPRCPPSVSVDAPYNFSLEWSSHSKLRDVVRQFQKHVDKLQGFWSTLDDIDRSFWVIDPKHSHYAMSYRQIKLGNDCSVILSINANDPLSLPECRFLGSDNTVNFLRDIWKRNCTRWAKDKSFPENLARVFDTQLPQPPHVQKNEEQVECGICYAQYLPIGTSMMNLVPRVEGQLIIHVKMETVIEHSTVFVLVIGSAPLRQQGSHSMFYLGTALTVQTPLQSKSAPRRNILLHLQHKKGIFSCLKERLFLLLSNLHTRNCLVQPIFVDTGRHPYLS
ncbi:E3 ubiquitin-protein ligase FANCL isoform X2 [Sesamum indicum]|uniref:E3 ubiquitin-protein ligase FANCL isoform X2 n=1 Tax=Sesamum indicum TaxID=4182 RepID=A0A8M8VF61_SESIN|nr:E3 ubiquitin-protein ligase FANCL isoform X2 [Sesamum indicum]